MSAKAGVVTLEESRLEAGAPLGIPVHRHHVREIGGGTSDPPAVPVDQNDAGGNTVARIEHVPYVRIAMAERVRRIETLGSDQALARLLHARVNGSSGRPEPIVERAGKARVALAILGRDRYQRGLVEKRPHAATEARVTPPERVEAGPRVDDALARLIARRQRPGSDRRVGLREIVQQEMEASVGVLR